jgi:hypothetical protein
MGSMSSDAAPLPRLGEVFFDVRGSSRSMRLSWYANTGIAVFSIWQGGTCTGTFRLPLDDLSRLVESLGRGLPDDPADLASPTGPIAMGGQAPRLAIGSGPFEPFTGAMNALTVEQAAAYGLPRPPQNGALQNGALQNAAAQSAYVAGQNGYGQAYGYEGNSYPADGADYATDPSAYNQSPTLVGPNGHGTGPQQFGQASPPAPGDQYGLGQQYGLGEQPGPGQQYDSGQQYGAGQQVAQQFGPGQYAEPQQYQYASPQYSLAQPADPQYPAAPERATGPQEATSQQNGTGQQQGTGPQDATRAQYGTGTGPHQSASQYDAAQYDAAQYDAAQRPYSPGQEPGRDTAAAAIYQQNGAQYGTGAHGTVQPNDAAANSGANYGAAEQPGGGQHAAGQYASPQQQADARFGAGQYGAGPDYGLGENYAAGQQLGNGQRPADPAYGAGQQQNAAFQYNVRQQGDPQTEAAQPGSTVGQYGQALRDSQYDQYGQPQQQGQYNSGELADAQPYGAHQQRDPRLNGNPSPQPADAQYGAGPNGQAHESAAQNGQPQYGQPQYGQPQYGQPQYGAATQQQGAQFGTGEYIAVHPNGANTNQGAGEQTAGGQYGASHYGQAQQQANAAGQGTPAAGGNPQLQSQDMPSPPATSVSGPQPVASYPAAAGQPAAQPLQAQRPYPAEQHHEQASAERSHNGQLSYDEQGYDDQGYAAPGREEQTPPGLEFSANFGNRGYALYGDGDGAEAGAASLSGQANGAGYGAPAGQQGQPGGHALAGQQGESAQEESAAAQYSPFGPPSPQQTQDTGQPQQAHENGRFPQFAQSLATLSAPVPADAAGGGQWVPGTQPNPSTGAYPAYEVAEPQQTYQGQPAYRGTSGQDAAGDPAAGVNDYRTAATGGQPTAPAGGYAYPEPVYAAHGYAPGGYGTDTDAANGLDGNGYGTGGQSGTGAFKVPGYASSGVFPANGQDPNGYYANGYQPNGQQANEYNANGQDSNAFGTNGYRLSEYNTDGYQPNGYQPNGHQPNGYEQANGYQSVGVSGTGGTPTFTPAFSPNGAASPQNGAAALSNGNGHGGSPGQPPQPSAGTYQETPQYQQARRGAIGEPDQPVAGYPNGPGYAGTGGYPIASGQEYPSGPQPDWHNGYQAAAQRPLPGYPAGPGQGYPGEYDQHAGHAANGAANGNARGRQTGPMAAPDHPSSPSYAPPDQFDPSQQGYWQ